MTTFAIIGNPIGSNVFIVNDSMKGRCLESLKSYKTGDIIFEEEALVFASYQDEVETQINYDILLKAFGQSKCECIDDYHEELANLDSIQSLDTARSFLQLIAFACIDDNTSKPNDWKMPLLSQLGGSNLPKCKKDIKTFRLLFPSLIPKKITDDQAALYLGILNNNQIELENYGGSGLFAVTSILEHNCTPNCSFSTYNNHLYLTAITNINPTDRLSIDYKNYYYSPTTERIDSLLETYNFICNCHTCCNFDRKRAFICPTCKSNDLEIFVCPIGRNDISPWSPCTSCHYQLNLEQQQEYVNKELSYLENNPTTEEEIIAILSEGIIHSTHYLIYQSYDELSMNFIENARKSNLIENYQKAIRITQKVVQLMLDTTVLPPIHHKKLLY